jgi:phosphoribosylaminoimidazole-succinocarboxamide synthase
MSGTFVGGDFADLKLIRKGKVREVYDIGESLLIVASDRISAFDVIMNEPIPDKGKILSQISTFWLNSTKHIIKNHLIASDVQDYPAGLAKYSQELDKRSMVVQKAKPLPVEFIVRGYIVGSAWKSYLETGEICGIELPSGLAKYGKLPEPIFTPSTKADEGHDENISFEQCCEIIGKETAEYLREVAIKLYSYGAERLEKAGLLLADTKFEFGQIESGEVILIDEALTPDSSRIWLKETYGVDSEPYNYDKQILRDYLETLDWGKTPPPPTLPQEIIDKIRSKYIEAYHKVTGSEFLG